MGDTCSNEEQQASGDRLRNTDDYIRLNDSVQAKDDEIKHLQKDLDEEIERSEELSTSNEKLTEQINDLKQQLTQFKEQNIEHSQAQYDNANIRQLLQEKQTYSASIEQKLNASQSKISELEKRLNAEMDDQKQTKQSLDEQIAQNESLKTKYKEVETERDKLLNESKQNQSLFEEKKDENNKLLKELDSFKTKYNELCEENTNLQNKQNEIKNELSEIKEERDNLIIEQSATDKKNENSENLVMLLERYKSSNSELNDENEQNKKEFDEKYAALNKEYECLQKKSSEMETNLSAQSRKIQNLNDLIDAKTKQINENKKNMKMLETKYTKLESDNANLKQTQNETEQQLIEMKQERDDLIIQTTTHKTSVAVKNNENKDLIDLLEQYKTSHLELENETDRLSQYEAKYNELFKQHNTLQEQLSEETRRADGMQELMTNKSLQIVALQEQITALKQGSKSVNIQIPTEQQKVDLNGHVADDEKFDQLKTTSTGPTVIGIEKNQFSAQEYATKINVAIDKKVENDKERIRNGIDVLIKCSDEQRVQINKHLEGTLSDKFKLYSTNKNVLKICDFMLKSLGECDAEWIHTALIKKDEDTICQILFSRTNQQIKALCDEYTKKYGQKLEKDIFDSYNQKDAEFVIMCQTLIDCQKRKEIALSEVNEKWAKNDAMRLKELLIFNSDDIDKAWSTLCDLCVNRSWSHLELICVEFQSLTKVSLLSELKKTTSNKKLCRKAVMISLQSSSQMHIMYANELYNAFKKKDLDKLQMILLSRSQIDLADIDHLFCNNSELNEGNTTRQWIEECTQSSLYQYILLSLLGLSDIQLTDRMQRATVTMSPHTPLMRLRASVNGYHSDKCDTDNDGNEPVSEGLVVFNPSIVENLEFNADEVAKSISSWIHDFNPKTGKKMDTKQFKEAIALLLTSYNAKQRGLIYEKYPKVLNDIRGLLKKGNVLELCQGFFYESIPKYNAFCIDLAVKDNDIESVGDILCTQSNEQIKQIMREYAKLNASKQSLMETLTSLCEKNKKSSVLIIFESLLQCQRNENALDVNMKMIGNDIDFLTNTKKFKKEEKSRFIRIFCQNNFKYLREINRQFGMRSSMNLEKLISKNLGSGSGYLTLTLLRYSIDPIDYFCDILNDFGSKFDKNKTEIARIFLSRSELDLNQIRESFANKQYGKELDKWVEEKSKGSKFGYFLICILQSIDRHNAIRQKFEQNQAKNEEKAPLSPPLNVEEKLSFNASDVESDIVSPTPTKKTIKPKYNDIDFQREILNDDKKRADSLQHLCSENNGFIVFLSKYLKPKFVDKVWNKLDSDKKGYLQMINFPDLITFVLILYLVKVHQQSTKTKTKPKIDNKEMRKSIEHLAVWIAHSAFKDDDEFKLTKDDFLSNFEGWCKDYVEAKGEL